MITDFTAYVGQWPFNARLRNSVPDLLGLMDKEGVAKAVVSPIEGILNEDTESGNRSLANDIRAHADRLALLAVINPAFPRWEDALDRSVNEFGAKGLKLYPSYHSYSPTDKCCCQLLEKSVALNVPVCVALRLMDTRMHHPLMKVPDVPVDSVLDLSERFPEAKIVIGAANWVESQKALKPLSQRPNLYLETSEVEYTNGIDKIVGEIGPRKLLFGTRTPFFYVRAGLFKIQRAQISDESKEEILHLNARRLLNEQQS